MIFFASLVQHQALFVGTLHSSTDKGKPVEKRGRKAKGLKLQRAVTTARLPKSLSVFIEEEKK